MSEGLVIQGRVLFIATVYTHLAAFHIPFMKLLQSWGYEVHAAAATEAGRRSELEAAGIVCHDVRFVRSPVRLQNITAYRDLRRLLRRQRFDLIHVHTPMAAWLGRLAAKRARQGPVLYTAHGFHFYRGAPWPYWAFYYPAERLAAHWTDGLIVMNGEDFERARQMGFQEGKDLFLVHGVGVDLRRFAPDAHARASVRRELGLDDGSVMVACVAEFTSNKDHASLLAAWKKVVTMHAEAQLFLIGDGRLRAPLECRVSREEIVGVHFLGFRSDVPRLLQATDVFVLPSRREGLPRSVMEAMAAEVPVVATDVRGSRDLVEPGATGLLVKLGDVEGLAEALLHLIRDRGLRERMGQAGRAKIQAYSIDQVIQEMSEIYARYLPKRGTGP
ncbi:MAG TPA: glycosyltransferase family 4 protein [Candidatus Bipolaricaulis sp.]|nr:glycosyltransferase family 4 protein [Candidatus Bipolaricaulis sp.]HRS13555.1 glycosyltransferase family 4 protein [Candidatus Bipolaricaulis sp.]HRU22015.1 glycosyltransferase family 4 protein [Candidatus Bipolaricaulis sp.]